jgi:uncharacterized protein (TIGR02453 family)
MSFNGFTPKMNDFFKNLKLNNNKEWFAENRHIYEKEVKETSRALVEEMRIRFANLGLPYIADPKTSLFRINRDIRFSANKEPYKTNLGIYFPYSTRFAGKSTESPGLYYHFDPVESFIGGGIHMPSTQALKAIRNRIAEDWEEMLKIIGEKKFKAEFDEELFGDKLKKMPRGFDENHPAADLLKMKEFTVWSGLELKTGYSAKLTDVIEKKAVIIAPFLDFIHEAMMNA